MKYYLIGLLFLTMTAAKVQHLEANYTNIARLNRSLDDIGDYIYLNRLHFTKILENYDLQLKNYQELYTERLERIYVHLDLLMYELIKNEEHLKGLEILSDHNRVCILQYRSVIPRLTETKKAVTICIEKTSTQFNDILAKPRATRNKLYTYLTNTYETAITNCGKKYDSSSTNYTICVTSVTSTANAFAASNQKKFASEMKLADCFSDEMIKRAVDCTFAVQNRTISSVAVTNVLINNCIEGNDECPPCPNPGTGCSNLIYIQMTNISTTIMNPFYHHHHFSQNCLIMVNRKPKNAYANFPAQIQEIHTDDEDDEDEDDDDDDDDDSGVFE